MTEFKMGEELITGSTQSEDQSTDIISCTLIMGSVIQTVIPIDNPSMIPLDGRMVSYSGIYGPFIQLLKNKAMEYPNLLATSEEYISELESSGQCGRFFIDETAQTFRVPTINKFLGGCASIVDLAITKQQSAPNITGNVAYHIDRTALQGAFYNYGNITGYRWGAGGQSTWAGNTGFDANRSSNTYGRDGTNLHPTHTKYPYYIVAVESVLPQPMVYDHSQITTESRALQGAHPASAISFKKTDQTVTSVQEIIVNMCNAKADKFVDPTGVSENSWNLSDLYNWISDKITSLSTVATPSGCIVSGVMPTAPLGYVLCDGGLYSKDNHSSLYMVIGDSFTPVGTDEDMFAVPDYRDCFLRGAGGNLAAPIGTKQLDGAPNIVAGLVGLKGGSLTTTGAFTNSQYHAEGIYGTGGGGYKNIQFNASRVSSSYGRDNTAEVRPINHAVYYYIKG